MHRMIEFQCSLRLLPLLQFINLLGYGYNWPIFYKKQPSAKRVERIRRTIPHSKFHGANMGIIWGRQDPVGPHVCPVNFGIWDTMWHKKQFASLLSCVLHETIASKCVIPENNVPFWPFSNECLTRIQGSHSLGRRSSTGWYYISMYAEYSHAPGGMMTSWNGNIFRVTGHAELWCFLCSVPE